MLEVPEDLLDRCRFFDVGDDLCGTTAVLAGLDVDVEQLLQALCPGHGCPAFDRCWVMRRICRTGLVALTALGRCHLRPQLHLRVMWRVDVNTIRLIPGRPCDTQLPVSIFVGIVLSEVWVAQTGMFHSRQDLVADDLEVFQIVWKCKGHPVNAGLAEALPSCHHLVRITDNR